MKQRTIRIMKIVLGAYLTFIGSMYFINIYNQRPSDMHLQIAIALILIISGIIYMVQDAQKLLEKAVNEKEKKAAKRRAAEEERRYRELHSSAKFRTAPMRIVKPVDLEEEEDLEDFEEKQIIITNYEDEEVLIGKKGLKKEAEEILLEETEKNREADQTIVVSEISGSDLEERALEESETIKGEDYNKLAINIEVSEKSEEVE